MKTLLNSDKYQYIMAYTFEETGKGEKWQHSICSLEKLQMEMDLP